MTPLYQFLERPEVFNSIVTGMVCFVVGAWVQAWAGKREVRRKGEGENAQSTD